jgi:hypothetical protein
MVANGLKNYPKHVWYNRSKGYIYLDPTTTCLNSAVFLYGIEEVFGRKVKKRKQPVARHHLLEEHLKMSDVRFIPKYLKQHQAEIADGILVSMDYEPCYTAVGNCVARIAHKLTGKYYLAFSNLFAMRAIAGLEHVKKNLMGPELNATTESGESVVPESSNRELAVVSTSAESPVAVTATSVESNVAAAALPNVAAAAAAAASAESNVLGSLPNVAVALSSVASAPESTFASESLVSVELKTTDSFSDNLIDDPIASGPDHITYCKANPIDETYNEPTSGPIVKANVPTTYSSPTVTNVPTDLPSTDSHPIKLTGNNPSRPQSIEESVSVVTAELIEDRPAVADLIELPIQSPAKASNAVKRTAVCLTGEIVNIGRNSGSRMLRARAGLSREKIAPKAHRRKSRLSLRHMKLDDIAAVTDFDVESEVNLLNVHADTVAESESNEDSAIAPTDGPTTIASELAQAPNDANCLLELPWLPLALKRKAFCPTPRTVTPKVGRTAIARMNKHHEGSYIGPDWGNIDSSVDSHWCNSATCTVCNGGGGLEGNGVQILDVDKNTKPNVYLEGLRSFSDDEADDDDEDDDQGDKEPTRRRGGGGARDRGGMRIHGLAKDANQPASSRKERDNYGGDKDSYVHNNFEVTLDEQNLSVDAGMIGNKKVRFVRFFGWARSNSENKSLEL